MRRLPAHSWWWPRCRPRPPLRRPAGKHTRSAQERENWSASHRPRQEDYRVSVTIPDPSGPRATACPDIPRRDRAPISRRVHAGGRGAHGAAAALTPALAGSAQAVSKPPPAVFGIRLVDVPVDEADNPRAYRYIIDHLNPGITIHRRVQIANLTPSAARITLYPDAAIIRDGSFVGDAGQTPSDLTTWITLSRHSVSLAPHARAMVTVTIQVPRTASPGNLYGVIWAQETNLGKTSTGRQHHRDQPRRHPDLPERRPRRPVAGELRHHLD